MLKSIQQQMFTGMDAFTDRIERKKEIYKLVVEVAQAERNGHAFVNIKDRELFAKVLENFAATLCHDRARYDLSTLYQVGLHLPTGALLIANRGATLYSITPRTHIPYITRHIGCCVYLPGLGIEVVNVGLIGNVYDGPIILRSESACTPSFLFGSQRCNCAHQWETSREIAAHFNPVTVPNIENGREFERWVQTQFTEHDGKHVPALNDGRGVVLMHVDTQNGMGSGYTQNEFSFDLFSRASLRHRGEYSAEQIHQTSMAGGFHAIGIEPDPRSSNDECGYKITPVILDWLQTSKSLIFLSNNKRKVRQLELAGYTVNRVKSIGLVNAAGAQEAEERGTEFDHLDIGPSEVTFEEEMSRLVTDISKFLPQ